MPEVSLESIVMDKSGDKFLAQIKKTVFDNVIRIDKRELKIEKSILGNNARIKGMCGLIYERVYFVH